ncbi:flagellin [bacterium]|nr:flagellin [bacterium]
MGDLARINTNIAALRAFQTLTDINTNLVKTQERISTGKVVNRASDSPSDYYISRTLTRDINAVDRNLKNIERGINFLQTNNSRLAQITQILIEASDLSNQANSIAVSSAEKHAIQQDITQLMLEMESIFQSGVSAKLFTGFSLGGLQNVSLTGNLTVNPLSSLTLDGINISVTGSDTQLKSTIHNIDTALTKVLEAEEKMGSYIRRLDVEFEVHQTEGTNLKASRSSIMDADLAEEQLELTNFQILQQAAISILSQANSAPMDVLSLFK